MRHFTLAAITALSLIAVTPLMAQTPSTDSKMAPAGKMAPADRAATLEFQKKTATLQRAVLGAQRAGREAENRLRYLAKALEDTPSADAALFDEARRIHEALADLRVELEGDRTIARRNEPTPPSIVGRVQRIVGGSWSSTSAPPIPR